MRLQRIDFMGDPFEVAQNTILGSIIVTNIDGMRTSGMVTEVEVYIGGEDKASHTYKFRKTKRVMSQYTTGGHAYVFLVYGIHSQFCVVLGEPNVPNVVLIRSIEPIEGLEIMQMRRGHKNCSSSLTAGPGNLTKALGITTDINGIDLCNNNSVYLLKNECYDEIIRARRIGIDYAEEYIEKEWRYYYANNMYVTHKVKK